MVSRTRVKELEEINTLESYISKNIKEEKESKELFKKDEIEVKTDVSEEETSIIARLKFLSDLLELEKFRNVLIYLMELRLSKGRKSRKEFLDSIKNDRGLMNFGNNNPNMGGFNNGRSF